MPSLELATLNWTLPGKDRQPIKRCLFQDDNNNIESPEKKLTVENDDSLAKLGVQLHEKLGSGGFGTVYLASCEGNLYALKQMHRQPKNQRASKESFEAETCALYLRHENVVRTLSVFECNDSQCILMEYVSRRTLQSVIDNNTCEIMSEERSLRFSLDISNALGYIHDRGIAHLDIKPANVLITSDDRCKLGDFGCCQPIGTSEDNTCPASPTKSNLTGTYAYRAPELLRGGAPSQAADFYSLGICLWQMMTREQPYANENHHVVIFGVVAHNLRPAIRQDSELFSNEYIHLMTSCWSKDPSDRPTSCAMSESLNRLIEDN